MEHGIGIWLFYSGVLAFAGVAGIGCDRSCASDYRCPAADPLDGGGLDPCPRDPADGGVAEDCGIWVAAAWGSDLNAGTQAAPVATLSKAIELAQKGAGRVYACGGDYPEAVALPAGITLAGGFSCDGGEWVYEGMEKRAIIAPASVPVAALTLLPGDRESLVVDVQVQAPDAVQPGGSSIAALTRDGARAMIRRCALIAGDGADGANGAPGDHNGAPAQKGIPGNNGADACTMNVGLGGAAVKLTCGEDQAATVGGEGGDGGALAANDGQAGLQPAPNFPGYGVGGKAEDAAQGTPCTPGIGGLQGAAGAEGHGATGDGHLTKDGYVGESGEPGDPGTPGQGGGGGGGAIGGLVCGAFKGGAGGGSGGTGGCGGQGGKGGQAGGSSIALAVLGEGLVVDQLRLVTGKGGNGGNGGILQAGGQGGLPGLPGQGFGGANGVKAACAGGAGGFGGNGGNGGGGRGGHSIGIAVIADVLDFDPDKQDYSVGEGGWGGWGGNASVMGSRGRDGNRANTLSLPK